MKLPRQCKTPADLRRDIAGQSALTAAEQAALVAAGLRAPNMRNFTLNSATAWDLFRPPPSMLPKFPLLRYNPVERDRG
jgi:hypothetical protein